MIDVLKGVLPIYNILWQLTGSLSIAPLTCKTSTKNLRGERERERERETDREIKEREREGERQRERKRKRERGSMRCYLEKTRRGMHKHRLVASIASERE